MKRTKFLPALYAAPMILAAAFVLPCSAQKTSLYLGEGSTFEFHKLQLDYREDHPGNNRSDGDFEADVHFRKDFEYPANGPGMTATLTGNEVVLRFPAYKDLPALEFHADYLSSLNKKNTHVRAVGVRTSGDANRLVDFIGGKLPNRGAPPNGGLIQLLSLANFLRGEVSFQPCPVDETGIKTRVTIGFKNGKQSIGSRVVTTSAETTAGEDGGIDVSPGGEDQDGDDSGTAGAVGGGLAVGIGAAAAAIVLRRRRKGKKKKKTSYRMYVYKDFGDAIQAGAGPVRVCARIARVEDGVERDDAGMTAAIVPSTTGLLLRSSGLQGRYMAADVSAEPGVSGEGTVTFTINTPSGTLVRHIVFRIVGETRIAFPALVEDGKSWDFSQSLDSVDVVGGMGGKARLRFVFVDAVQDPASISFSSAEGFQIAAVKETSAQFTYYAEIINRTGKLEKEGDIFHEPVSKGVDIRAEMPDGSLVTGRFRIIVYPDGITIDANRHTYFKKGRLEVDTFAIKLKEVNGTQKSAPVPFAVYACYVKDGEQVVRFNPPVTFGKLEDGGRYGNTFPDTYRCRVTTSAPYKLFSLDSLCQIGDPYEVTMGVSYKEDGQDLSADIPLRLIGESPTPPPPPGETIDREKELERLKKDIQVFGLADPDLRQLVRNAPRMSGNDLRYVRWHVVAAGKAFYEGMSAEYASFDKVVTKYIVVSSSLVSLGDKAVEIILAKLLQSEDVASIAAAVFNPFKNAFAEFVGQWVCRWSIIDIAEEGAETTPFVQSLIQGVQDGIETYMFSDKMVPTRKELTEVVSAYLLYCFAIHYWYGEDGEEGDLAKSLIAAVKDLAFAKIKNTISTLAGDVLKKFAHSIGEKVGPQLCALFEKQAKEGALKAGSQAFEKTLREQAKAAGKVTFEGAKKALETKGTVIAFEEELARGAGEVLKKTAPKYAEGVAKDVLEKADFLLAHVLNYFFAGTLDTNELLGNSTHEVLINAFCDRMKAGLKSRWGLDVEEVSEKLTNPLDVSAKLDGNLLTLSIFSCSVVIDIQKNLEALFGILFELSFGWMEDLWKYLAIQRDFNVGIDDPEYDKSMFERMADRARQAKEGLALEKRKGK